MTTNKTTALIEAFRAEVNSIPMGQECVQKGASAYNWGKYYLARLETLAAFEQLEQVQDRFNTDSELNVSPVRELSVEEVAMNLVVHGSALNAAKALAKLGTIRVVEE